MILRLFAFLCMSLATAALAQQSAGFPRNGKFIIQLTSSQLASSSGEDLVPPLLKAFKKAGMVYANYSDADFVAIVETGADVGAWYSADDTADVAEIWLYERFVTVGLSPAGIDIEPYGELAPSFSVTVTLVTTDQDRVDELHCLIAIATGALSAGYETTGHLLVNGSGCARK